MPLLPISRSPREAAATAVEQRLVGQRIDGAEPAAGGAQHRGFGQHPVAAGIGMGDASCRIDQKHASAQRIETVGERCSLDGLEIDHPANQSRTANVRSDEREPPAHLVVSEAVGQIARDEECRAGRCRFLDVAKQAIDHALRKQPFPAEARSAELVTRDAIGNDAVRLLDGEEQHRRKSRIEPVELFLVEPRIVRVVTPREMDAGGPAQRLLRGKPRAAAAHVFAGLLQDARPKGRIERSIVDVPTRAEKPRLPTLSHQQPTCHRASHPIG